MTVVRPSCREERDEGGLLAPDGQSHCLHLMHEHGVEGGEQAVQADGRRAGTPRDGRVGVELFDASESFG